MIVIMKYSMLAVLVAWTCALNGCMAGKNLSVMSNADLLGHYAVMRGSVYSSASESAREEIIGRGILTREELGRADAKNVRVGDPGMMVLAAHGQPHSSANSRSGDSVTSVWGYYTGTRFPVYYTVRDGVVVRSTGYNYAF